MISVGARGGAGLLEREGELVPYMELNLLAGLFHAAASLGIAASADHAARQGLAARINGDARPRMQVADNAIDLAAARGVLGMAAQMIVRELGVRPKPQVWSSLGGHAG